MNKRPVSVSLDPDNLLWLRARAVTRGRRSVSETLDELLREARAVEGVSATAGRSVVGTVRIADGDPDLAGADAAIREIFATSLGPPSARPRAKGRRRA